MSSSKLIRRGGPAALLGGLLFVVYAAGFSLVAAYNPALEDSSVGHAIYHVFNVPPNALMFIGIIGLYLYLRQSSGRFGIMGKIGFYICAVVFALTAIGGLAIIASETMLGGAGVEVLDAIHPMVLLLMLGSILFGIGVLRSGAMARGGALMLVVVPVLMIASLFVLGGPQWAFIGGMALFGLGWAWLGYDLWSHQNEEEVARNRLAVG